MVQRLHVGMVIGTLGVRRRVPCGEQQRVARSERQVELGRQVPQQLAACTRPPGLDEAQVPGGDPGGQGKVELAPAAPEPPIP